MNWPQDIAFFFGGIFLTNAVPHLVSGLMGKPFQSPFAKPPGEGYSRSTVNVLWGFINLVVGYGLTCRIGSFDIHSNEDVGALGLGILALALFAARHFGRFNGGNAAGK